MQEHCLKKNQDYLQQINGIKKERWGTCYTKYGTCLDLNSDEFIEI